MVEVVNYDEIVEISSLEFDPDNPNILTDDEKLRLKNSVKHLDLLQHIVIDQHNKIADGEHRVTAAKQNGMETVHCIRVKLDDDLERRQIRQALNKVRGHHDTEKDYEELEYLAKYDDNFLKEVLGVDNEELKNLEEFKKYAEEDNKHFNKRSKDEETILDELVGNGELNISKDDFNVKKIIIEMTEEEYESIEGLIVNAKEDLKVNNDKDLFVGLLKYHDDSR